jgi:hypothetical protein
VPKNWDYTHDPDARPTGCNGKYGKSGAQRHRREGEDPCPRCPRCHASAAHYMREYRRGALMNVKPGGCGTYGGTAMHKAKGEPTCFKCRVAEAAYRAELREKQKYPKCKAGHYQTPDNVTPRADGPGRCRECAAEHERQRRARRSVALAA